MVRHLLYKVHNKVLSFNMYMCGKLSNNLFISCHRSWVDIQRGLISQKESVSSIGNSFNQELVCHMILNL